MREILDKIFLIEVPLPGNPLKSLNSYLIKGDGKNLLIDTGFNNDVCYTALMSGLESLDVDMSVTDIFLTHLHSDHSGLCARVASPSSKVLINQKDMDILLKLTDNMQSIIELDTLLSLGFTKKEIEANAKFNPILAYKPPDKTKYTAVMDGDVFEIGRYRLRAVETPGHTPGHTCLYDEHEEIIFCGDHVLFDISPNITNWQEFKNPLAAYIDSLRKVKSLAVKTALCAHRGQTGDFSSRIDQLIMHHDERLEEVLQIIASFPGCSAYEIASKMRWQIRANGWNDFHIVQKWFAVGEAAAHLEFLESKGEAIKCPTGAMSRYYTAEKTNSGKT